MVHVPADPNVPTAQDRCPLKVGRLYRVRITQRTWRLCADSTDPSTIVWRDLYKHIDKDALSAWKLVKEVHYGEVFLVVEELGLAVNNTFRGRRYKVLIEDVVGEFGLTQEDVDELEELT